MAKLLTIAQKAQEIEVHPETLRRWRKAGKGPAWVSFEGMIRYYPHDAQPQADEVGE